VNTSAPIPKPMPIAYNPLITKILIRLVWSDTNVK
jgi:hypothetical protein